MVAKAPVTPLKVPTSRTRGVPAPAGEARCADGASANEATPRAVSSRRRGFRITRTITTKAAPFPARPGSRSAHAVSVGPGSFEEPPGVVDQELLHRGAGHAPLPQGGHDAVD